MSPLQTELRGIKLDDKDLKEIFALFSSTTKTEKAAIYQRGSGHHLEEENLAEEYSLTEEKREFSLDAWRAVISLLNSRGFALVAKDGQRIDLSFIEKEFI